MCKPVYIYALTEPEQPWNIRYVGKTVQKLEKRLKEHIQPYHLFAKTHKNHWIKSVLSAGLIPQIKLLDIGDNESWENLERFYIQHYKKVGFSLTNGTEGGDGGSTTAGRKGKPRTFTSIQAQKETIKKYGRKASYGMAGKKQTKESKKATVQGIKKYWDQYRLKDDDPCRQCYKTTPEVTFYWHKNKRHPYCKKCAILKSVMYKKARKERTAACTM